MNPEKRRMRARKKAKENSIGRAGPLGGRKRLLAVGNVLTKEGRRLLR